MRSALLRFSRDDGGAMALEYGLVCVFVVLMTVAAMRIFGDALIEGFPKLATFPTIE